MKLVVLGSVHGNLHALTACLNAADAAGYDLMLHTGDLAGSGPHPNECIALLRRRNVLGPRGPWDAALAAGDEQPPWVPGGDEAQRVAGDCYQWTRRTLTEASRRFLAALPFEVRRDAGRMELAVYHASPVDLRTVLLPSAPEARFREQGQESGASVIVLGSAPMAYHRLAEGHHFINVPSLGMPADGQPGASYAVIHIDAGVAVSFRQVPYDAEAAARAASQRGLPPEIALLLRPSAQGAALPAV